MFKVNISNSSQNLSWSASFPTELEAQAWLALQIGKPHRLPEREVSIEDDYAQEDVLEVIEEEVEGVMQQVRVRLRAQYSSEIVDISAQVATEAAQAAARALLNDSDWKRHRHISQKALGVATSMTEEEYLAMEQACQAARNLI
jgi:hypothetical protein